LKCQDLGAQKHITGDLNSQQQCCEHLKYCCNNFFFPDWKLEQNPVSGFLSLLKNVIAGSPLNQEQLMKNNGLLIIGVLLAKVLGSVDSAGYS
jgi:hypothetical protein